MNILRNFRLVGVVLAAGLVLQARPALACAACYGQSDSPLAAGMNWGIFSLLAMVVMVLSGIASFFIFLAKKSAANPVPLPAAQGGLPAASQNS
jgi:hypothetical protein